MVYKRPGDLFGASEAGAETTATCFLWVYVALAMGIEMADAFLSTNLGEGYNQGFYDYHKLAYDEMEAFDYEQFKKNGFDVSKLSR